jgi:F-type H+-transporting ATPase subunit b
MDLPLGINIVNIFIYIILFGILYFVLAKFLFPALDKAMKDRADKIAQTVEDSRKAEELLNEGEKKFSLADKKVDEIVAEGKKQAKIEYDKIIAQARDDARDVVAKAHEKAKYVENESQDALNIIVEQKVRKALSEIWQNENSKVDDELIKKIIKES